LYGGAPATVRSPRTAAGPRLAELGVRFVQLYHKDWDHHGGVKEGVTLKAQEVDRACMALSPTSKLRDMLKDTLVVWAAIRAHAHEQGGDGRDTTTRIQHLAVRRGDQTRTHLRRDRDSVTRGGEPLDVHDLHATMLRLLGIEQHAAHGENSGLDARLTNVSGKVLKGFCVKVFHFVSPKVASKC